MKHKSVKRSLTLLLTAMLSLSLAACSGNSANNESAPTAAPPADATAAPQEEAKLNPDEPAWKLDTSPIDLTWFVGANWYAHSWGESLTSKYVTEKTGVNVKLEVPSGEANEHITLMMTSGQLPDLISMGSWETAVKKLWEGDHVFALNELADQYDPYFYKVAGDGTLKWYRQENGNTYGIPNDSYSPNLMHETGMTAANQTFLVRKDLYEEMGSPDLSTPEGFLGALQLLKDKYPEYKGQPMSPFFAQGNVPYGMTEYLQNLLAVPHEKDGKVYDRVTDPEYLTWLKTFRTAYERGLINVDFLVDSDTQVEEKTNNARYFMMIREWTGMTAVNPLLAASANPDSYYIAVDGPQNSKGDSAKLFPGNMDGWMVTMISKSTKNPERAIRFLTYLASEEGQQDLFLGKEGETWETVDGKPQLKADMVNLIASDIETLEKQYGVLDTYWMMRNPVIVNQWRPEKAPVIKQMEDFANSQADIDSGIYKGLDPLGDSEVAVAWSRISQNWEEVLPELITAKDEAAFDKVFASFLERRDEYGFQQVVEFRQAELDARKTKMAN
ncbi:MULTISPECIES: extracellular solute-binding protein [unclassified Paenibacillus]|uniref:extracellular solute-binding protein n=1 Tax=unclassified Paenibacillus TaxID=185978 RepID=UPI0024054A1D|nr:MULTISPECIES: extracellular solute-binding protein [unclassified Paenibacillus]MDF9839805.1 putative aldouronate transport system substrate-binding protein [Paenibacillus sp. PastF-2]MDF9846386.1 putative aldouronate transport system substrate-binding protein [Paenibacillus sp. PastM-2]MDF9853265.1 putative aldouronate transport system substrate-binding protein [Paenibacillus sp. PastF-1]MDH6478231.1 putative aldouronate transport system substrate-binding protein [Paenibacillus sp. PastH-2]